MNLRKLLLTIGVAVSAWLALFADKTPSQGINEPVARSSNKKPKPSTQESRASSAAINVTESNATKSQKRILKLHSREDTFGKNNGTNPGLFLNQSWTPPPPPTPKALAPLPPTAPPLPFTFLGKKMEDSSWEIFLSDGDQTIIAKEKSVISGNYQVQSIRPPTMTLLYLPLKQMQTIHIGEVD